MYLNLLNLKKQQNFYFNYKSDDEHQKSDWNGIHEKICQSLIPLRTPQQFLPSEEERKKRDKSLYDKKVFLLIFFK